MTDSITRTRYLLLALLPLALALPSHAPRAAYANLEITTFVSEIVGSTAIITGSGSNANTDSWSFGDNARFILQGDDGTPAANAVTYGLDVRPVSTTGGFQSGTDSLMIARTVDSQGLTDTGSLSIYISPENGNWSGEFQFSFYDGANGSSDFSTSASLDVQVTSLDLDFDQRMELHREELTAYGLNDPTNVVVTDADSDLIDFQGKGQAEFSDPTAAVIARYDDLSAFDVVFTHDSVALFMFEFRNPPLDIEDPDLVFTSTRVPAPPSWLLLMVGGLGLVGISARRRRILVD